MIDPVDTSGQAGFGHRRRRLFRQRKIPVRYLVPNFFTLLSLCVGVTAIRLLFEVDTDATDEQIEKLIQLTERYCVILQTLKHPPTFSARRINH